MKTKLLSKLMMVALMAVIVGCGGSNKENSGEGAAHDSTKSDSIEPTTVQPSAVRAEDDCNVCDDKETHRIDFDSIAELIQNFDNAFIKTELIANAGGVINLDVTQLNKIDDSYKTVKFHWGFDSSQKRLSLTCEASNKPCSLNVYSGKPSVEDALLFGTHSANDFKLKSSYSNNLTKTQIITHFITDVAYKVVDPSCKIIKDEEAKRLLGDFNTNQIRTDYYPTCDDIVFNKKYTIDEISAVSKTNIFRYYFGLDLGEHIKRKLRVILVGMTDKNKLVVYDLNDNLMIRETSRPRP